MSGARCLPLTYPQGLDSDDVDAADVERAKKMLLVVGIHHLVQPRRFCPVCLRGDKPSERSDNLQA